MQTNEYQWSAADLRRMDMKTLTAYIENQEAILDTGSRACFCPNHTLEIYLFEYYDRKSYDICEVGFHKMYGILADQWLERDNLPMALHALERALHYNSVDIELLRNLADCYLKGENWEMFLKAVKRVFPFCYTCNDIAAFYRLIGRYYVATYQPELAEALYAYSNLFYKSDAAEADLQFIETAMKRSMHNYTIEDLQKILGRRGIPLQPKEETLGIVFHTAAEELKYGDRVYAEMLFLFLYQLTQDKEIEGIIQSIKNA